MGRKKVGNRRGEFANQRTGAELAADRLWVAEIMIEGKSGFAGKRYSQYAIATMSGVSQSTVGRDIAWLEAEWKERAANTID